MRRLLALLILTVIAGGCGGSSSSGSTNPSEPQDTTTTTPVPSDTVGTPTTADGLIDVGEFRGDLPAPCSFLDGPTMTGILGSEVTVEESFGTDCFYEPVGGMAAGPSAQTSAWAMPEADCVNFLQTEPIFPGEVVAAAPGYGDRGTLITSEYSTSLDVCVAGAEVIVKIMGEPSVTTPEQRLAAAQAVLEAIVGQL